MQGLESHQPLYSQTKVFKDVDGTDWEKDKLNESVYDSEKLRGRLH